MEYPRAYKWNILGNMILYPIWASPRNMQIRIPHVGLLLQGVKRDHGAP